MRYIAQRIAHVIVVLLLVTLGAMLLVQLSPGDPAVALLGENATPEAVHDVHVQLGLDRPIVAQYKSWVADVARADFGRSFKTDRPVLDLIREALPVTAEIVLLTVLAALAVSIPLGVYCGAHAGGLVDRAVSGLSSLLVAVPPFVSVPALVYLFVLRAHWFPATGWVAWGTDPVENLRHLVLPVGALAAVEMPVLVAALRSDVITTLQQDFILGAQARGVRPRTVLLRHALRPSSFSLITLAGVSLGRLVGGAVIVEVLFALPGIGTLTVNAINGRDVPLVQGIVLFVAIAYVAINTLVDLAYSAVDPRVRVQGPSA